MFWARAVTASSMKVSALRVYRSMRNQADTGAASTEVDAKGWQEALLHRTKGWNDAAFANGAALVLFLLAAWPLLLTEVPPYQDVPNHLASATVIANPDQYPEYVFNGFFKTNSALFAWMLGLGRFLGFRGALKVFTALVLAANAVIIPHFVLQARGRRTMLVATLFAWPLVHNWFVCMGMLDFALAVPLSFLLLMLLERRLHHPTWSNALAIAGLGLATWYAHVFPVMVVLLLVGVRVLGQLWAHLAARPSTVRHPWRGALHELVVLVGPLLPVVALVLRSLWVQVSEPQGALKAVTQDQRFLPAWEFLYNAWAEYLYNFTYYSAPTALIALCLVYFAWTFRRRSRSDQAAGLLGSNSRRPEHSAESLGLEGDMAESAPSSTAFGGFLSGGAVAVLGLLYVLVPYSVTHWYHVNSRFLAYLWLAALVRVPERISRGFAGVVAVAALVNSLGLGLDFKRLDGETKAFSAGIPAVPEGARLLPLVFKHKDLSDNTRNLVHLWGLYVEEKHTSAPLLFAHSYSFPVTHREPPAPRFHELRLEGFANLMASPERFCTGVQLGGMSSSECKALWIREWGDFWQDAQPRFNYVLTWDMPSEVEAHLPSVLQSVFRQGKLGIYRFAEGSSAEGSSPDGKKNGSAPTGLTP